MGHRALKSLGQSAREGAALLTLGQDGGTSYANSRYEEGHKNGSAESFRGKAAFGESHHCFISWIWLICASAILVRKLQCF